MRTTNVHRPNTIDEDARLRYEEALDYVFANYNSLSLKLCNELFSAKPVLGCRML